MGEPQAAVVSQEELAEDQAMGEDPAPAPAGNEAAGEDVVVNVGPAVKQGMCRVRGRATWIWTQ